VTLPLTHSLGYAESCAVAAKARVDYRSVRAYLEESRRQRPATVDAIERALRALGLVAKRPKRSGAEDRTLPLFTPGTKVEPASLKPKRGADEEDE
jgi:hypothetical protein